MPEFNPFSLVGKRILITGATSGLGYATAIACAKMGATIIGVGRNTVKLEEILNELNLISSLPHQLLSADLIIDEDRDRLVAQIQEPLNGLVHCAGISALSPVRMINKNHLRKVQEINVEAPTLLTQALLKKNLLLADGSIIFLSSIAAHIGVAGVSAYSGTKAALQAIARCLAMEVINRRIRVNCLSPALVETSMLVATAAMADIEKQRSNYPLGFGKPDDVANAAIFLLSDASRWITGTTIIMDGGLTIS